MLKIGYIVGEIVDPIVKFGGDLIRLAITIAVVVGIICIPIAAVKYLFFS